jgi:hypothetical protein
MIPVRFQINNFKLVNDGYIRIILNEDTLALSDTLLWKQLISGSYSLTAYLVNNSDDAVTSPIIRSFTVDLPDVAAVNITPASGTYKDSVEVTLTTATEGAKIYYTTDGSNPTALGTLYNAPFVLKTSATVKAIAVKDCMDNSTFASAAYTIELTTSGTTPQCRECPAIRLLIR